MDDANVAESAWAPAPAVAAPRAGFRRLLISLGFASGATSALYAGVGSVLLPQQIENVDRPHKVAVLGLVAGVRVRPLWSAWPRSSAARPASAWPADSPGTLPTGTWRSGW